MHFTGLIARDVQGSLMGYFGENTYAAEDWKYDSIWTAKEWELMNFEDSISLEGTSMDFEAILPHHQGNTFVASFPNPTAGIISFYFQFTGLAKVKMCIVDSTMTRLFTYSGKDSLVRINYLLEQEPGSETKYEPGVLYRLYYTCSTTDSLNFYKGHGDIMWCDEPYPILECLDFIP
jgi:hypothetical protein